MSFKQSTMEMSFSSEMISNAVKSFTLSKKFTKSLMRASILNILYQRLVLNNSDLKTRDIDGTQIIVFKKKNVTDPLLRDYLVWIKGVGDAINKNYLKNLFIFMKNPINNDLIESYKFSLKYSQIDAEENVHSTPEIKTATLELFQVINDLGKNGKLSENTEVMMEFTYVDTTPSNYEPPGFEPSLEKFCFTFPEEKLFLGTVRTGFHRLTCVAVGEVFNSWKKGKIGEVLDSEVKNVNDSAIGKVDESDEQNSTIVSDSVEITDEHYSCFCQLSLPLDLDRIECLECGKQYHAPCHGYLHKEEIAKSEFVCVECCNNDPILGRIAPSDRLIFCRLRLVLYYIKKQHGIPTGILKLLSENQRNSIMEKLRNFKIVGDKYNKIDHCNLINILQKFFVQDNSQTFS